jgi:DNA-binding PadR family transcriptional regulator
MLRTVTPRTSPLEHAILGLLHQQPMSGYALRKVFATTPMSHFSDSPGSIYPALGRLRRRGLVTSTVQKKQSLRPRQVFRLSSAGLKALSAWVSLPVSREEVTAAAGEVMLRFVFAEQVLGAAAAVRFLESYERSLADYVPELERYCESATPSMLLGAQLALRNGVAAHRTQLQWVRDAIREFRRAIPRKEAV